MFIHGGVAVASRDFCRGKCRAASSTIKQERRSWCFEMKRQIISWGLVLAAFIFFLGCRPRVTVQQQFTDEQRTSAQKLITNWSEFDIHFFEWVYQTPVVAVFDIKNDDKTLRVGSNWQKIRSEEDLKGLIKKSKIWGEYAIPNVSAIIGPDGKVWGYAITAMGKVTATVADERTIDVQPPKEPQRPSR